MTCTLLSAGSRRSHILRFMPRTKHLIGRTQTYPQNWRPIEYGVYAGVLESVGKRVGT
jgi:hypothetical protein